MGFLSFIHSVIRFSTVFIFGSTGESLTEKSGHLNLGIPGVMCFGAIGGCIGASTYIQSLSSVSQINGAAAVLIPLLFTIIFGSLMGLLYSFFTVTLRCNQNVVGLTITTFGVGFYGIFTEGSLLKKTGFNVIGRYFGMGFMKEGVNWFGDLFLSYGTLVYLAFAVAIIVAVILRYTRVGLNIIAVGESPATADSAGVNVTKYRYLSTIIGSAIAGLGGLFITFDFLGGYIEYNIDAYGWLAVALVIFTIWRPDWGILGSLLFSFFYMLPNLITASRSNQELLKLLPYVVTIVVLIITSLINKRETQPPTSLGLNYFREER
ncbi:MAG: ABC transporter permease [Clostridia bacterium]|nr:ABC transporter permease [Clostridia bacterium]